MSLLYLILCVYIYMCFMSPYLILCVCVYMYVNLYVMSVWLFVVLCVINVYTFIPILGSRPQIADISTFFGMGVIISEAALSPSSALP